MPNRRTVSRPRFTAADRNYLWVRDRGICQLCKKPILPSQLFTGDHIKPVSHGGSHIPSNWRLSHKSCNQARGNRALRTESGGYVR
jgi:5-methylcytosine-specific restriction endonuclease McrA